MKFKTDNRKSPMKWLPFPKEAIVTCKTPFLLRLIGTFNLNLKKNYAKSTYLTVIKKYSCPYFFLPKI
jgi:hypothetical protein